MDQVKQFLSVMQKHGFWIGSGIILIGTVAVWFMTVNSLDAQTKKQISGIETDTSTIVSVRNGLSDQPNEKTHEEMRALIADQERKVLEAWQERFDEQRDILKWPTKLDVAVNNQTDSFNDKFRYVLDATTGQLDKSKLKLPFEVYESHDAAENDNHVTPSELRFYADYIGVDLPNYAKIIGAKWEADFEKKQAVGGMAGGVGELDAFSGLSSPLATKTEPGEEEPLVRWSKASQETLLTDLFPWRSTVDDYPSELEVYYSQENLWILEQMLRIIAQVNGDAKQAFEAEIREIKALKIGSSVDFSGGKISAPGSRAVGGGFDEMDGEGYPGMGEFGGGEMEDSFGGSRPETESPDPGENRYVNTALEPITASSLRTTLTGNQPQDVALAIAKRIPVQMDLVMDQRSIQKLLAACGTAPLKIDVRHVSILPKSSKAGGFGGMAGGEMGGEMGGEGMSSMGGFGSSESEGGFEGFGGGGPSTQSEEDEYPLDMNVKVTGLIYFYNPPSKQSLGVEEVNEEVSIDQSAEVIESTPTPPVTAPATTPAPATSTDDGTGTTTPVAPPANTPPATTPVAPPATGPDTATPSPPSAGTPTSP
jgi:hypothetical protein